MMRRSSVGHFRPRTDAFVVSPRVSKAGKVDRSGEEGATVLFVAAVRPVAVAVE